jgi:Ca2+-binding EF-hand superfamily protein
MYHRCLINTRWHVYSLLEYSEAFDLFDRDKDHFINAKELSLLIRSLEFNPTAREIQQLIDDFVDKG